MPFYNCKFMDEKGLILKRTIFSDSRNELRKNYENSDKKLVSIRRNIFKGITYIDLFSSKISYTEFLLFNQKLSTLLKAGISFIKSIGIIINNTEKGNFKEILKKVEADINNGIQISDAFSSEKIPFVNIYRATLLAGEKSGNLEELLEKFNIYLEKISTLRKRVFSSLAYPIIVFVFMFLMMFTILVFAIPKFSDFYRGFNAELPGITKTMIEISNFIQSNLLFIIITIIILYFILKYVENKFDVVIFDLMKIKIPFIGSIISENNMAVFSRTLSILLQGGIPVPESTEIAVKTFTNKYFVKKIKTVPEKIKEGMLLSQALAEVKFIPNLMVEIVEVGESSGNLIGVLEKNGDYYENSINTKINSLISLIEPIMIVILGIVIAFMLISIYLPIFNLVNVVDSVEGIMEADKIIK
ncbi:MAG: type II secretion system F family protein [Candidatus Aminicenantes bacterium]|nr:type II secretion system F family protein [Candidatus Aminicenantes bacterium]